MADDRFYSRVNTSVSPIAQRDPAAFRSGFAEGLQELGQGLGAAANDTAVAIETVKQNDFKIAELQHRRTVAASIAENAGRFADLQGSAAGALDDLRTKSKPGAAGYMDQANDLITKSARDFLDSLPDDPEVRQRLEPMVAQWAAQTRIGEQRWALKAQTQYEGDNYGKWQDTSLNTIAGNPTPQALQDGLDQNAAIVGGLDVDGTTKERFVTAYRQDAATTFVQALIDKGDYAGAKALLTPPADGEKPDPATAFFTENLDPKQRQRLLTLTANGEQAADRQVALADSHARSAARDGIQALETLAAGGAIITAKQIGDAQDAASAANLPPDDMARLDVLSAKNAVNRVYQGVDSTTMRRDQAQLGTKIAAGKATQNEQIEYHQLGTLIDDADKKETAALKRLWDQGIDGKVAAFAQLTGDAQARYAKAEKLGPGMGFLANLGPVAQRRALAGAEILTARPKDFGADADVRDALNAALGPLVNQIGGRYKELHDTAWHIYAADMNAAGKTGFDQTEMTNAIRIALGAQRDGSGVLHGGLGMVRGKPVLLPSSMTSADFDTLLSRSDFSNAVYRNGDPASKADVLARYRPEWIGDDNSGRSHYHFVDPAGGLLMDKGGSPLNLAVAP